ncbi:FtsH protease activity modulator HflK [Roseospirillum parvum]|uniref:Protein HflK n=1 Tax=Roseospirillum parvum TaxID=83401 RepID=A0A1G7WY41_9PROT|nr:FtsH protease activity modulator HflK [Roseospirillum parvum]SDG76804.1 membrane protease subunit HflK [Roseospirillum parvum]
MKVFNQQGGPWGGGPGGGSPWGGGGNGNGDGRNPWGGGGGGGGARRPNPPPPDIEDMLRKGQEKLKSLFPGGMGGKGIALAVIIVVAAWAATGFYRVQPDEQGVELLFGAFMKTTSPGLNYWFPAPVGDVIKPKVTVVNSIQIGFRGSPDGRGNFTVARDVPEESLMLTGDQNIIDARYVVQWQIADAGKFLFNIRDPEVTIKAAAESAMREVVGTRTLDSIMTEGRGEVQFEAKALIQEILDSYKAGVSITGVQMDKADPPKEVIDAFNDVQRARQDKERLQNEAQAYRNDILPRAKGQAARVVQAAEAYKAEVMEQAKGEAQRFDEVYDSYTTAREVTRQRLFLETMQDVLGNSDKVIIDPSAEGGQGVTPYLPLPEVQKRRTGGDQR